MLTSLVQSSLPRRDHGAYCDRKIRNCSARGAIYCRTIIKDLKRQIFVDVSQEGMNHYRSCFM
jgi:hypothetical protein